MTPTTLFILGGAVGLGLNVLGIVWNATSVVRRKQGSLGSAQLMFVGVATVTATMATAVLIELTSPLSILAAAFLYIVTAAILLDRVF